MRNWVSGSCGFGCAGDESYGWSFGGWHGKKYLIGRVDLLMIATERDKTPLDRAFELATALSADIHEGLLDEGLIQQSAQRIEAFLSKLPNLQPQFEQVALGCESHVQLAGVLKNNAV